MSAVPPADLRALLQGAWGALQQGRPAAAREVLAEALQLDAANFDAWRLLAMAEQGLGRGAASIDALRRAHALRPADPGTVFDLGSVLLQAGDVASARPLLEQAMAALPRDPKAAFRFGTAAYVAGDMRAAARGFETATRLAPDWGEAWNNLSAALGRLQEYAPAIVAARHAIRIDRASPAAWHALAALQSNLSDRSSLESGREAAEKALALDPARADTHRIAAILARKLGEPARAEAHARQALRLAPDDIDTIDTLGEQLLASERAAEAVRVYAAALARGIDAPTLRRQHGIALLQEGRYEAARSVLADAHARAPDDQRTIAHLGAVLPAEDAESLLGLHRHVHRVALPAPDGFADAKAFHAALAEDVRRHSRQRWEPAGLAARRAYLSGDLLADRTPAITGFEQRLRAAIDAFIAGCHRDPEDAFLRNVPDAYVLHVWSTRAEADGYIDTHIHEASWLSGAYYVTLPPALHEGDPRHAGWIEFGRPYAHLPAQGDVAVHLACPREGELLLFPSYLFHRTLPYAGGGERISISFDLAAA